MVHFKFKVEVFAALTIHSVLALTFLAVWLELVWLLPVEFISFVSLPNFD